MRYIALVDGKAGAYGVVVPDLPGCTSAGSTTDAALRNAVDAVRLWVEDPLPRQRCWGRDRGSVH
jgi:predicted RNase H-like HicB family nuclease